MIGATYPARIRKPSPGAAKSARALVVVSILLVPSLAGIRQAGALLDPFAMSPTAGPPGTVVHLSGSGCAPGIAVSPASDYVKITSSALSPSTNIPVAANGSWSGSVTVPATAPALPGLVVATCFTDGFLSLTATYAPKTFTVTSAPPPVGVPTPTTGPSTPTTAPATVPGPTPTTVSTGTPPSPSTGGSTPRDNRGGQPGPGPTTVSPGPAGTGGAPGSSGSGASPGGTAGHAPKNSGSPGAIAASRPNLAETASAAGLADPSLARASRNDGSNSVWLLWLVLLLLVAAASAFLWWWHRRLPGDSEPTHEAP